MLHKKGLWQKCKSFITICVFFTFHYSWLTAFCASASAITCRPCVFFYCLFSYQFLNSFYLNISTVMYFSLDTLCTENTVIQDTLFVTTLFEEKYFDPLVTFETIITRRTRHSKIRLSEACFLSAVPPSLDLVAKFYASLAPKLRFSALLSSPRTLTNGSG